MRARADINTSRDRSTYHGITGLEAAIGRLQSGINRCGVRSAILLAIHGFVIYPALPVGTIDRWGAFEPRAAWLTVMLIAGIGFINYTLLKIYGERGIEIAGFLGGFVNSSVTVSELAARVRESNGQLVEVAYRGILLATAAMFLRNSIIILFLPCACWRFRWCHC